MGSRNWKQFDWDYPVVTSATGLDTFIGCPRSWVFEKVWRMPKPPIDAGPMGNCLHDVAQRYVEADARGIDLKTGREVDLFPDGWAAEVSAVEAELVRKLIARAIEEGVLRRLPNAVAELPFQYEAAQGASVMGFGDYVAEDGYEDHKTTSNFRYNLTPEDLAVNVQMLVGAGVVISRALVSGIGLTEVWLRHNYFLKDRSNPKVKSVEATVTVDEVKKFWEEIVVPVSAKMVDWKRKLKDTSPSRWREVPKATSPGTCKKYKGCPFARICGGAECPDEYKIRMNRENAQRKLAREETDSIMTDIFDTAKRRKKPVPPPEQTQAETETVEAETTVAVVEEAPAPKSNGLAPWRVEDCIACSENPIPGFNSKGDRPCKACDAARRRLKLTTSGDYELGIDDGVLVIEPRDGIEGDVVVIPFIGDVEAAPAPAAKNAEDNPKRKARREEAERKAKAATADKPETTATEEPPVVPPPAKKEAPAPAKPRKAGTGRPRKGFTLVYGTQKRGRTNVVDLHQALLQYGTELAEAMNAKSYYELDFGKRRDWLASRAEAISETFGPAVVLVTGTDPDVLAFASALEPFAADVFIGR